MNNVMTQTKGEKEAAKTSLFTTKQLVTLAMLSALAYVLMLIHLPFKYIGFLELEFSDVPAVVASIVYGPVAGVIVELIKNTIKAVTATTTGGVGELANFIICACYVAPIGILFRKLKGKGKVVGSFVGGCIGLVLAGIAVNYFITVPLYAKLFGGMDVVVGVAAATVPAIKGLGTVVLLGITPFNIVKGPIISVVSYLVYKVFRKSLV
jgi:riboflavin transporter FmnP